MMDLTPPDQKRARLGRYPVPQWQDSAKRQLPPPPPSASLQSSVQYASHVTPLPRLDAQECDRRTLQVAPTYETQATRKSSSVSHSYHLPTAGQSFVLNRDSMGKREPPDDSQFRPSPTSIISDNVNAPQPLDSTSRFNPAVPNYETGRSQSYPPASYSATPIPIAEPFGHLYGASGLPTSCPLPPPRNLDQYIHPAYGSIRAADQQIRKKAQRAAQACDSCRTAKAKCDEGRPACTSCRENGKDCRYRDPPPKQQDKASADIIDSLNRLEAVMHKFTRQIDHLTNEVIELKKSQRSLAPSASTPRTQIKQERDSIHSNANNFEFSEASILTDPSRPPQLSIIPSLASDRLDLYPIPTPNIEDTNNTSDEDDDAAAEPGPPKQPSIPVNHTTGAARLLLVPPIKKMCADIMLHSKFKSEKYPYLQEWKRGLLRLYGRGEGYENPAGYDRELAIDHVDISPADCLPELFSPVPGEEWGHIGFPSPSTDIYLHEIPPRGITTESIPDFSRETVLSLVLSFKKNINNMHPLLIPRQLDQIVENFLRSTPDSGHTPKPAQSAPLVAMIHHSESPGRKRKRSPAEVEKIEMNAGNDYRSRNPARSISSAIVLLCMALGKICLDKGKIPQLHGDQEIYTSHFNIYDNSPTVSGFPNSPQFQNPSVNVSFGTNKVSDSDYKTSCSRRTSPDTSRRDRKLLGLRNIDVIPGLVYFALATDILGNQMAGSSLQHVHANILAGLYHAQLARIMESAAYISNACRALQVILRPRLDRFRKVIDEQKIIESKDNPLIFAFWTCLQLESDIVAEIPCPQTGILTFEEDMPGPNLEAAHREDGFEQDVIESYSAQLFLRKHLNSLHCMFYRPRDPNSEDRFTALVLANNKGDEPKFPTIELLSQSLNGIEVYAPTMRWMVDQPEPPSDILGARLRAKYYGAQVITYRPFVLQVLERSEPPCPETMHGQNEQISDEYLSEVKAPIVRHDIKEVKDIDPKALEYVRLGLIALINSTTAFHGLGDPGEKRIIVTNVWGTAHAQWGNMLTLQAAYMNPILNPLLLELITKNELITLVEKTLGFLALVGSPTSALAIDWKILNLTSRKNGLRHQPVVACQNFPSASFGD